MLLKQVKLQIYFLQLENYDLARFLRLLPKIIRHQDLRPRKAIVWTLKLRLVLLTALIWCLGFWSWLGLSFFQQAGVFTIPLLLFAFLAVIVSWFFFFVFLALAVISFYPLDWLAKSWLVFRAKRKLARLQNLTIIGITGSYGKTTLKEMLAAVLAEKFRVLKTAENLNTPLGLARLILHELTPETEILLVEMGAYRKGDIKKLCKLAPPKLCVLTGINASHLERFGSLENTIHAKFEIVQNSRQNSRPILNADNELILQNYQRYLAGRIPVFYGFNRLAQFKIKENRFLKDRLAREVVVDDLSGELQTFLVPLPGRYAAATLGACLSIARQLGMSWGEVRLGLAMLKPIKHRLEPFRAPGDVLIIDDSYNGNPEGVNEALALLEEFPERRKIYVTPGLVELGSEMRQAHFDLADRLKAVADLVVLVKSEGAQLIKERLTAISFPSEKMVFFGSAQEAHAGLSGIIKAGDLVLFQNDLPDNYTL